LPYIQPAYKPGARMPRRQSLDSIESSAVLAQLEEMIRECKESDTGMNVVLQHLLINLLIRLSRIIRNQIASKEPPMKPQTVGYEILVRNVCSYLEDHFDQRIVAEDLAKRFILSSRHLQRIFRRETGKSISTMLQDIRMERAKQMLLETNKSIDSIATAVGFHDPSFFNRLFTRYTGFSPSRYRKKSNHR
jgi:AraC family transcriptional regulator, L-rhamnose operon transcriptional activator RhaR